MTHADELSRQQRIRHIMTVAEEFEWLRADAPCSEEKARLKDKGFSQAPTQHSSGTVLVSVACMPETSDPVGTADLSCCVLGQELHARDELRLAPQWFTEQGAYLVRENREVVGLVHYSDLNRLAFRACIYHQVLALEQAMIEVVKRNRPEPSDWGSLLGPACSLVVNGATGLRRHAMKGNADLHSLADYLYTKDLLLLCRPELEPRLARPDLPYGEAEMQSDDGWFLAPSHSVACRLNKLRNSVAHVGKPVVTDLEAVGRLAEELCWVAGARCALRDRLQVAP